MFCAERFPVAGSDSMVALTDALLGQWAVGEDDRDDLRVVLAWIAARSGGGGAAAAAAAVVSEPADVVTSPAIDHDLCKHVFANADSRTAKVVASAQVRRTVGPLLEVSFARAAAAVAVLDADPRPEIRCRAALCGEEIAAWGDYRWLIDSGRGHYRDDNQRQAIRRFRQAEAAEELWRRALVTDDPFALAEALWDGSAIKGVVVAVSSGGADIATTQRRVEVRHGDELVLAGNPTAVYRVEGPPVAVGGRRVLSVAAKKTNILCAGQTVVLHTPPPDFGAAAVRVRTALRRLSPLPATHDPSQRLPRHPRQKPDGTLAAAVEALR
jgi:hypothetical protein